MNVLAVPPLQSNFLKSLSPADLDAIEPQLRDVQLRLGTVLCATDEPIDYVYFPTCGMVSIVTSLKDGQEIETGIVGRTGIVGSAVGTGISFSRCTVQIAGEGRRLSRDGFLDAYDRSKTFRNAVNAHNMGMWALSQQCAACNAAHQLENRMARWLLEARELIQSDDLPLTQEFLAMMLGVRRTSVTMAQRRFQADALVRVRRGHVQILDADGLHSRACECFETNKIYRRLSISAVH